MRLTQVRQVVDALGLSFHTVKELNKKIDTHLSGRPRFQCKRLTVDGEPLEFYSRDVIESIRCLYSDPRFAQHLVFAPERHYTSNECTTRIYNEMYTGDWWWKVQVRYTLINQIVITNLYTRLPLRLTNRGQQSFPLLFPLTRPSSLLSATRWPTQYT
jgi:hypothetical protein